MKSTSNLSEKTIEDFGEQWTTFTDNEGYYGSTELFADVVGPLISPEAISGLTVADIGSGTGRFVSILLLLGARHVYAVEPSKAFRVLKDNTAAQADRISYLNIPGH